jgi:hypothetical protein
LGIRDFQGLAQILYSHPQEILDREETTNFRDFLDTVRFYMHHFNTRFMMETIAKHCPILSTTWR